MDYRTFCTDKVSTLGFGCMRFPQTSNGEIDEERAFKLLKSAYESGINYYDTAYPYHNGKSEPFLGKFLSTLKRNSFFVATKLPVWEVSSLEDAKNLFQKQLDRLQLNYIDFYLLHALNQSRFDKMVNLKVIDYLLKEQKKERIRHLGFSFHDSFKAFQNIITYRKWDFCQIQYNYMDTEEQAGEKGRKLATTLGIPLIIMEPVKGGSLANLPAEVSKTFTKIHSDKTPAFWALRYAAEQNDVCVVLSGMSAEDQLKDNINTFSPFVPLSEDEEKAVLLTKETIKKRIRNGCTGCNYCMPCPFGVDIPRNFKIWNNWGMYENKNGTFYEWKMIISEKKAADLCQKCGACEEKCPQNLPIRTDLTKSFKELKNI